jgi:predicted RNase H-like HicB family nuclease
VSAYAAIIEGSGDSFSAYVPELPGCIATGESIEVVESLIRAAIRDHVQSLRDHGEPVPEPTTAAVRVIEVA